MAPLAGRGGGHRRRHPIRIGCSSTGR